MRDLKERRPFELYGYCLMTNQAASPRLCRPRHPPADQTARYTRQPRDAEFFIAGFAHSALPSTLQVRRARLAGTVQGSENPVVQGDRHLLRVFRSRYIEANPVKAGMVDPAGDYAWSSFAAHGLGEPNDLLDPAPAYQRTGGDPKARRRKWSRYVHRRPAEDEVQAIARSIESGLPYGSASWIKALSRKLKLDLTIRPRGQPKKQPPHAAGTQ